MSEEKIRNYKTGMSQVANSENIPSFLLKTYEILENPKYSDVICWTKNGQGFVVKRVKEFAENILPTHFRHSNYTSFVRQLNMYDFHKTRQENQENAFKNAMFKKGQKHLLKDIERKDYKKKKQKPESMLEKSGAIQNEAEPKTDKKIEVEKQFYSKSLTNLEKINQQMEKKQNQLADINKIQFNDEGISRLLQQIMNVKNMNNTLLMRVHQMDREWDQLLMSKKKSLKMYVQENEQSNGKAKQQCADPTFYTFNNLAHPERQIE